MPRPRAEIPELVTRNGVYQVSWYDPERRGTKRLSLRTRDDVEARHRYAAFLASGLADRSSRPAEGDITVARALDDYYLEHVAHNCMDKVRQENLIRHLKAFFGEMPLRQIDIPACRRYAQARRLGVIGGGKRSPERRGADGTIRRELNGLKAAANHALAWKRITQDAMPTFELPPAGRAKAEWLTKDEIKAMIAAASGDLKAFLIIGYYTGARRHSIESLTKEQVFLEQKRINLQPHGRQLTKKRKPVVPIFPEMAPCVEALMARSKNKYLFGEVPDFYRPFALLAKSMGFEGRHNPHILRHSRATHMLQDGVSIYAVAKLLGDTVQTIERVYGHHSPEYLMEGTIASTL
jgi:integrase